MSEDGAKSDAIRRSDGGSDPMAVQRRIQSEGRSALKVDVIRWWMQVQSPMQSEDGWSEDEWSEDRWSEDGCLKMDGLKTDAR